MRMVDLDEILSELEIEQIELAKKAQELAETDTNEIDLIKIKTELDLLTKILKYLGQF